MYFSHRTGFFLSVALLCAMRLYMNFVMSLVCIAVECVFGTCLPAILECAHTLAFICICNNFMCRRWVSKQTKNDGKNLNIRDFIWVNLIVVCITSKHAHIHTIQCYFCTLRWMLSFDGCNGVWP